MFKKANKVKLVTSIGAGPIGGGWAAHFLAQGFKVNAYLHSEDEIDMFNSIVQTAWVSLTKLGLAGGASLRNLEIFTKLEDSLQGTDFVQESAPERLDIKQGLYEILGRIVPNDVVISSSTSGLTMTEIQQKCSTPERTVIGHPFNPPYLLPLVEIVGGKKTNPDAVLWAADFYKISGKSPLVMKKEIPGFVATRLQEALWREALHMVANEEATPADIDNALINGPAPRMAVQGPVSYTHLRAHET